MLACPSVYSITQCTRIYMRTKWKWVLLDSLPSSNICVPGKQHRHDSCSEGSVKRLFPTNQFCANSIAWVRQTQLQSAFRCVLFQIINAGCCIPSNWMRSHLDNMPSDLNWMTHRNRSRLHFTCAMRPVIPNIHANLINIRWELMWITMTMTTIHFAIMLPYPRSFILAIMWPYGSFSAVCAAEVGRNSIEFEFEQICLRWKNVKFFDWLIGLVPYRPKWPADACTHTICGWIKMMPTLYNLAKRNFYYYKLLSNR